MLLLVGYRFIVCVCVAFRKFEQPQTDKYVEYIQTCARVGRSWYDFPHFNNLGGGDIVCKHR